MDLELTGKTALVTGASKGIGKAIARGLAHEGVRVAVCSRDATTLSAAAKEISAGARLALMSSDEAAACMGLVWSCAAGGARQV